MKNNENWHSVGLRLEKDIYEGLLKVAIRNGRSISATMRVLIQDAIHAEPKPQVKRLK